MTRYSGRWLIIPVEVQVRELLGRLMVAAIAADRGYQVLLGHDRLIRRMAPWLPRGIVFDKGLGSRISAKHRRFAKAGMALTVFDEESTGFSSNPELTLSVRLSRETLTFAHKWFAVSDPIREHAERKFPDFRDVFVTTGMPRTDTWREAYRPLFAPEVERLRARHGRYILFCSNFGSIVHGMDQRFIDRQMARHQKVYAGADAYRSALREELQANLEAFLAMLPQLRQWFPQHGLVVRPHPSESTAFWRAALGSVPGVTVTDEGVATPWILGSDCLVHHGCTTGIEAGLMGKPHVMYAPHPDRHHDTPLMKAIAPFCTDLESLRAAMHAVLEGEQAPAADKRPLEHYFASLSGPLVSERIVDEFDRIELPPATLSPMLPLMRYSPRNLVSEWLPRPAREAAYRRKKYPGVALAEVDRALAVISACSSFAVPAAARQVMPQLFHIARREEA